MDKRYVLLFLLALPSQGLAQTGFLTSESSGDLHKTCNYNVLGDTLSVNVPSSKICPLSHKFDVETKTAKDIHGDRKVRSTNQPSVTLDISDSITVECSNVESAFNVTFFPRNGPTTVYLNNSMWHRFNKPQIDPQSIRSVDLTKVGYKKDITGKTFKGIDLDRVTGKVQISSWSDYSKSNFLLGDKSSKRDVHLKFKGDCRKVLTEPRKQKF